MKTRVILIVLLVIVLVAGMVMVAVNNYQASSGMLIDAVHTHAAGAGQTAVYEVRQTQISP